MKRAAIYSRVSTDRQGNANKRSLPEQEQACRDLCMQQGYEVVEVFVRREKVSGADLDRPQLEEIFKAARDGKIEVIVVDCIDRLSREPYHMAAWMVEAERYGVTIEFVDAPDDATEEGRMLRDMLGIFARHERRRIQERTTRMRRARAKSGMLNPGTVPLYGYCWSDAETKARYVIDEQVAPVVKRIFEEVAAGVALRHLAHKLTNEGILPPGAYHHATAFAPSNERVASWWYPATIRRMILNPSYVGEHAAYKYARFAERFRDPVTGLMKKRMKVVIRANDDHERIEQPGICPPIVSHELAATAQARLAQNKREATKPGVAQEVSLLRGGFVLCGYCNVPMYCVPKTGGLCYFCRTHKLRQHAPNVPLCPGGSFTINQRILDSVVWKFLTDALTTPRLLERRLLEQEAKEGQKRLLGRIENLQEAMKRLDKRRLNYLNTLGEQEDESTRAWLSGQIKELAHQIKELAGEIHLLEEQSQERSQQVDTVRRLVTWGQRSRANLDRMTLEEKRQLLFGLGVKVHVWNSRHNPRATIELGGLKSFPVTALPLLERGGRAEDAVTNSSALA